MFIRINRERLIPATAVFLALLCASCLGPRATSFFSKFSTRELVERNKAAAGLNCDPLGGGDTGNLSSAGGAGTSVYHSSKSEGFACRLNSEASFDESRLFSALKLDTERALRDNGLQIVDSGSSGPANFFFAYASGKVHGRIEVSGKRSGDQHYVEVAGTRVSTQYYNVQATLEENGN